MVSKESLCLASKDVLYIQIAPEAFSYHGLNVCWWSAFSHKQELRPHEQYTIVFWSFFDSHVGTCPQIPCGRNTVRHLWRQGNSREKPMLHGWGDKFFLQSHSFLCIKRRPNFLRPFFFFFSFATDFRRARKLIKSLEKVIFWIKARKIFYFLISVRFLFCELRQRFWKQN